MNTFSLLSRVGLSLGLLALGTLGLGAQTAAPALKKLGVSDIKPTPAIVEAAKGDARATSLDRVVQALDGQLLAALQNTRKFELIARSDLASLLKEADFKGGSFSVSGVDYLLVTTLDDFQDYVETADFGTMGKATKRIIRVSCVAKLYDSTSGKLLETANFAIDNKEAKELMQNSNKNGDLSDKLLQGISRMLAEKVANRMVDVTFPAKIVARTDKLVTINRGDGTGIAVGQVWQAFALGEELIDPDTGASLGREEVPIGTVRITAVLPKVARAEVVEDNGIANGVVVRRQSAARTAE